MMTCPASVVKQMPLWRYGHRGWGVSLREGSPVWAARAGRTGTVAAVIVAT